jgi:hypothetical protein
MVVWIVRTTPNPEKGNMNEVILTLVLVSPTYMTTVEHPYDPVERTCEEAGEELVGEWITTPTQRYVVTGYHCQSNEVVTGVIYPNQYKETRQ